MAPGFLRFNPAQLRQIRATFTSASNAAASLTLSCLGGSGQTGTVSFLWRWPCWMRSLSRISISVRNRAR